MQPYIVAYNEHLIAVLHARGPQYQIWNFHQNLCGFQKWQPKFENIGWYFWMLTNFQSKQGTNNTSGQNLYLRTQDKGFYQLRQSIDHKNLNLFCEIFYKLWSRLVPMENVSWRWWDVKKITFSISIKKKKITVLPSYVHCLLFHLRSPL